MTPAGGNNKYYEAMPLDYELDVLYRLDWSLLRKVAREGVPRRSHMPA